MAVFVETHGGKLKEIEALDDYWDKQVVTERELRPLSRNSSK